MQEIFIEIILSVQSFLLFLLLIVSVYAVLKVKSRYTRFLFSISFGSLVVILLINLDHNSGYIPDPKLWRNIALTSLDFSLLNIAVSQVRTWTKLQ